MSPPHVLKPYSTSACKKKKSHDTLQAEKGEVPFTNKLCLYLLVQFYTVSFYVFREFHQLMGETEGDRNMTKQLKAHTVVNQIL